MRKLIFPSVERDHARQHERKSDLAWPRPNQMLRRGPRSSRLPPSPPGPGGYHDPDFIRCVISETCEPRRRSPQPRSSAPGAPRGDRHHLGHNGFCIADTPSCGFSRGPARYTSDCTPPAAFASLLRVVHVEKKTLARRYVSLTTSWTAALSQASMAERPIALPPVSKARGHANQTILERRAV